MSESEPERTAPMRYDLQAYQRVLRAERSAWQELCEGAGPDGFDPSRLNTWTQASREATLARDLYLTSGAADTVAAIAEPPVPEPVLAAPPRTTTTHGAAVGVDDEKILHALAQVAVPDSQGATRFQVGIRNHEWAVYRVVTLMGLRERANFARQLEALGYEDERFSGLRPPAGYHALYSKVESRTK